MYDVENENHSLRNTWSELSAYLEYVVVTQADAIRRAAVLCTECIERDGVIHTFGSGHSRAFAAELVHRAGGLAPINRIDLDDLALYGGWPLERVRSLECERDPQAGRDLLSYHHIEPQDIFVVASQSGVNAAIVEYAQQIKARHHQLIVLTSLKHTQQTLSRHPSGQKLYEIADIVIDNGTNHGDTLLQLQSGEQIGSASSLVGVLIAQLLNSEIVSLLQSHGKEIPAFVSDNVEGGIERNMVLQQRYEHRVRYRG